MIETLKAIFGAGIFIWSICMFPLILLLIPAVIIMSVIFYMKEMKDDEMGRRQNYRKP